MPEEDGCCESLKARWTQVKRHALGVSEVVFLTSSLALALMELPTLIPLALASSLVECTS